MSDTEFRQLVQAMREAQQNAIKLKHWLRRQEASDKARELEHLVDQALSEPERKEG